MKATILTTAAVGLLLAPLTVRHVESAAVGKPNIVLLFADDLERYASAYADPALPSPNDLVKTPVFDRIAAEGARFDNAFVSLPSCTLPFGLLSVVCLASLGSSFHIRLTHTRRSSLSRGECNQ